MNYKCFFFCFQFPDDHLPQPGRSGLAGRPLAKHGASRHHRAAPFGNDHLFHLRRVLERQPRVSGLFGVRGIRPGQALSGVRGEMWRHVEERSVPGEFRHVFIEKCRFLIV